MNTEKDKNDFYEERQSFIKWAIRNHYDVSETTTVHGVLFKRQSTTDAWLGWLYSSKSKAEKPKDCVVVPVEPTDKMLEAARDWSIVKYGKAIGNNAANGCYKAMVEAARGGK